MLAGLLVGIGAALLAPFLMTVGFIILDKDWGGSAFALNVFKCGLASGLFLVVVVVSSAEDMTTAFAGCTTQTVVLLMLSAFLGITLADIALLQALQLLGAKRVIIIETLKPFLAALLGALFLGEAVDAFTALGIALTSLGVLVFSLEKEKGSESPSPEVASATAEECADPERVDAVTRNTAAEMLAEALLDDQAGTGGSAWGRRVVGYALAASNVVLDAVAALLTKRFGAALRPPDICLLRFGSAFITMAVLWGVGRASLRCSPPGWSAKLGDGSWCRMPAQSRAVWGRITASAVFISFLYPLLFIIALLNLTLALTLTLTSLGPLYALPLLWLMKGERVTLRAVVGSLCACGGVALLCWTHSQR
eukprot:EG_transcript_10829